MEAVQADGGLLLIKCTVRGSCEALVTQAVDIKQKTEIINTPVTRNGFSPCLESLFKFLDGEFGGKLRCLNIGCTRSSNSS